MTYGNESHAASVIRRGSKMYLNSARQYFHYYVGRGPSFTYMASRHPEKPHIYLPKLNLWALLWLVSQSHHSPKGWKSYSIPATFTAVTGELGTERQTESTIPLPSQLEYIYLPSIPRPGLLALRKKIKMTAEPLFLNSSVENY